MRYRHTLPEHLVEQALLLDEFANGGAQCQAQLMDGSLHEGLLISNSTAIIAMRGQSQLPFDVASIVRLFQSEEDRSPAVRGGWKFFDAWTTYHRSSQQPSTVVDL